MVVVPFSSWLRLAIVLAAVVLLSILCLQQLNVSIRSEVEVLEERLLDCTSSKSSGKEVAELGSAEKCMYEYELTLSFQATMGRTVMLDRWGVELMCSILKPHMEVLEYGSGGSTTFFSQFVKSWTAMEHNNKWEPLVTKTLKMLPWGDRVTVYLVERDMPSQSHEGIGEEYRSYIDKPVSLGRKFHLIIDDGRARVAVGEMVKKQKLLLPGGRMMIHDWERKEYKQLVNEVGFSIVKEDKKSRRHMALLKLD